MASIGQIFERTIFTHQGGGAESFYQKIKLHIGARKKGHVDKQIPVAGGVLFVNGCDQSVPHPARYRVFHQIEQLRELGIHCDSVFYLDLTTEKSLPFSTIVYFRCPITDEVRATIERAHRDGKKVFFDVDDLVVDTKYTNQLPFVQKMNADEKALFDDGVSRTGETLKLCDAAITTTGRLAEELRLYVPDVTINRNVASKEMLDCAEQAFKVASRAPRRDKVVIGYFSGSMTHNEDFKVVEPALIEVMKRNSDIELLIVGDLLLSEGFQPYQARIRRMSAVSWRDLPSQIASADINIAPLADTIFNQAKSENKWVDASLVRIPTVASNVGAFNEVIRNGETGVLCSSTDEWIESLLLLVQNPEMRNKLGMQAYAHCSKYCTTVGTGLQIARTLCGFRCTIDSLLALHCDADISPVASFLTSYGLEGIEVPYDSEPWKNDDFKARYCRLSDALNQKFHTAIIIYERLSGDTSTFRYYAYNVEQSLHQSKSWKAFYFYVDELEELYQLLPSVDLCVLLRVRMRPEIEKLLEATNNLKTRTAYFIDDDAIGWQSAAAVVDAMVNKSAEESIVDIDTCYWYGEAERFRLASEGADCFIASTSYLAGLLQARYGKKSFVISPSINFEQAAAAQAVSDGGLSRADKPFTIGYFSGTESHNEDFALIVAALADFLEEHQSARLLLVGRLELPEDIYSLYARGRVVLLPPVDYVTLQAVQACADVVIAPLVLSEFTKSKSGLKVFEAGSVRTPAIASAAPQYIEAIEEGKTGFICCDDKDWFDSFSKLADDPSLRQRMGEDARDFADEHYSMKAVGGEVELVFDAIRAIEKGEYHQSDMVKQLLSFSVDWDNSFDVNPRFGKIVRDCIGK